MNAKLWIHRCSQTCYQNIRHAEVLVGLRTCLICLLLDMNYMLLQSFLILNSRQWFEERCRVFLEIKECRIQRPPWDADNSVWGHSIGGGCEELINHMRYEIMLWTGSLFSIYDLLSGPSESYYSIPLRVATAITINSVFIFLHQFFSLCPNNSRLWIKGST